MQFILFWTFHFQVKIRTKLWNPKWSLVNFICRHQEMMHSRHLVIREKPSNEGVQRASLLCKPFIFHLHQQKNWGFLTTWPWLSSFPWSALNARPWHVSLWCSCPRSSLAGSWTHAHCYHCCHHLQLIHSPADFHGWRLHRSLGFLKPESRLWESISSSGGRSASTSYSYFLPWWLTENACHPAPLGFYTPSHTPDCVISCYGQRPTWRKFGTWQSPWQNRQVGLLQPGEKRFSHLRCLETQVCQGATYLFLLHLSLSLARCMSRLTRDWATPV